MLAPRADSWKSVILISVFMVPDPFPIFFIFFVFLFNVNFDTS